VASARHRAASVLYAMVSRNRVSMRKGLEYGCSTDGELRTVLEFWFLPNRCFRSFVAGEEIWCVRSQSTSRICEQLAIDAFVLEDIRMQVWSCIKNLGKPSLCCWARSNPDVDWSHWKQSHCTPKLRW
jgi:hypothetical protein